MSDDAVQYQEISAQFFSAIAQEIPSWIKRLAESFDATPSEIDAVSAKTVEWVGEQLELMLATEPNELRTNPLAILRSCTRFLDAVLRESGLEWAKRDSFLVEQFPDDVFDLNPANFADVSERLAPMGIAWGAARAHLHLSERR